MNKTKSPKDTFWTFLTSWGTTPKEKIYKPFYWLTILFSASGIGYKIYNFAKRQDSIDIIEYGLYANIAILCIGVWLIGRNFLVDYEKTKVNINVKSTPYELYFRNEPESKNRHVWANKMLSRFVRAFSGFLLAMLMLYLFLYSDLYLKNKNLYLQKSSNAADTTIVSDLRKHADLLKDLSANNAYNIYTDTAMKSKFAKVISDVENSYSLIYENSLWKDVMEITITLVNNIGMAFAFACFWLLFINSLPNKEYTAPTINVVLVTLIILSFFLAHIGARFLASRSYDYHDYIKIHRIFRMVSGIGNAVALSLFYGKFNSRHFKPTPWLMFLFFTYAAAQTMYCMFDYIVLGKKQLIMEVALLTCLLGKSILILYVYWLLSKNRIYYYFLSYPKATAFIEENWEGTNEKEGMKDKIINLEN